MERIGNYRLIRVLGEGGMGIVHLAETPSREWVALKVLRPHIVGDEEARQRLAREVATLSRVTSERVAAIIDADPWGDQPFVVTEYVAGPTLRDHVRDNGPMGEADLWDFAGGLSEAVAAVHAVGVLHRDIKPGNVLVEDGNAVLIDFGLARLAEDPRMTATGWLLGTPGYLAPEVLHGDEPTPAADVHALAATLAFAATGRAPAGSGPPMAIMDRVRRGEFDLRGVPPRVLGAVREGLDPVPAARPTVDELLDFFGAGAPSAPAAEPTLVIDRRGHTAVLAEPRPLADAPLPPPAPFMIERPPEHRLRQGAGVVGVGLMIAAVIGCVPWVGAAVTVVLAALLRFASVTAQRHARRREVRGRARWYDVPASTVAAPMYLASSLVGSVVLVLSAAVITGAAAFVFGAANVGLGIALPALGILWTASLWWGPGGQRVREWAWRGSARMARPTRVGPLLLVVGVIALVVSMAVIESVGASWFPASSVPWTSGWMHSLARWMH